MQSPYGRLVEAYEPLIGLGWSFDEMVRWYCLNGFVHSTPSFFVMGRPVPKLAPPDEILSPTIFRPNCCDAWYCHAVAGDMSKAWTMLPWELPWMCFDRQTGNHQDKGLRFYRLDKLRSLSSSFSVTTT